MDLRAAAKWYRSGGDDPKNATLVFTALFVVVGCGGASNTTTTTAPTPTDRQQQPLALALRPLDKQGKALLLHSVKTATMSAASSLSSTTDTEMEPAPPTAAATTTAASSNDNNKKHRCICKWPSCYSLQQEIKKHAKADDPWSGGLQSVTLIIPHHGSSAAGSSTAASSSIKTLAFVGGIKHHFQITEDDLKNRTGKYLYIARHHFSRALCASRKTRTTFLTKVEAEALDLHERTSSSSNNNSNSSRRHADAVNEVANVMKNVMGQPLDAQQIKQLYGSSSSDNKCYYVQAPLVTELQVLEFVSNKCVDDDYKKYIATTTTTTTTATKKKDAPAAAAAAATKIPAPAATTTTHQPAAATAAVALVTMQKTATKTTPTATAAAPFVKPAAPPTAAAAAAAAAKKTAATRKAAPPPAPAPPPVTMPFIVHPPGVMVPQPPPVYFGPPGGGGGVTPLFVQQPRGIGSFPPPIPPPPPPPFVQQPVVVAGAAAPSMAAQEEDFQLSLYHYCLWKHQQIKRCTKKPPPPSAATATAATTAAAGGGAASAADTPVSPQNAKPSPSTATTTTTTNNNGTGTNTTTTTDWGRIVATLEQEIPHIAEFKKAGHALRLEQTTPPVLAKLYTELPIIYQQVEWLEQRVIILEAYATQYHHQQQQQAMMTTMTTTAATAMPGASNKNNIMPGGTNHSNKKRKAGESRPTDAIDWSAFEKTAAAATAGIEDHQAKKKFKTASSLLPKGAPKQVVDLVKTLKADARNERKNASKVIKRLEAKVQDVETERSKKLKAIKEALEKKQTAKKTLQQSKELAEAAARAARSSANNSVPFETRIEQLEHFRKGHGHCDVPTSAKARSAGGLAAELSWWVQALRKNWRLVQDDPGKLRTDESFVNGSNPTHLSQSRIAILDKMGFRWTCGRKIPMTFEERYEEMKSWKAQHGHVNVPRSENKGLGEFAHMYRSKYKAGTLSKDKIEKLEAIGFKWQVRGSNLSFEERVEQCKEYRRQHGHVNIPAPDDVKANKEKEDGDGEDGTGSNNGAEGGTGTDENQTQEEKEEYEKDQSLRRWAKAIRLEKEKFDKGLQCRLNKTKIKQLDSLGFDWTIQGERLMRRGKGTEGNLDPPNYMSRRHSEANEQNFDARIKTLTQIKDAYGNVSVESRKKFFGEDKEAYHNLYWWMRVQRRMFVALKAGKWSSLTENRLAKLRAVEFDFEPRAHYNYKKKGNNEEEQEDDTDDEQDGQDREESPPHIPVRRGPEYTYQQQQQQQQQQPQYQNYQQHAW